eukprot:g33580.t1
MVVSAIVVKQYFSKMPTGCAFVTQPGLVGLLLGALPEMWKYILRYEAHSGLAEYHEQEGDTLYFDFGLLRYFMPAVVITRDPRNVKYMLKTKFDSFVKGVTFHTIGLDLLGDGIFNVDGDLWFKQRKTASQMFTANRFKQHIWKVVRKNCDKVISLLRASQEPTVDIFNVLNRFTLDSIGEIGFGTDIGSLENPESPFLGSFDAAQRLMFIRFVLPCWRLLRFLGLGPERHSRHHMQKLREYSRQIVVGGAGKGGILVRKGVELTSEALDERLSTGAVLEELVDFKWGAMALSQAARLTIALELKQRLPRLIFAAAPSLDLKVNWHDVVDYSRLLQKGLPSAVEALQHQQDSAQVLHSTHEWWELKAALSKASAPEHATDYEMFKQGLRDVEGQDALLAWRERWGADGYGGLSGESAASTSSTLAKE